MTTMKHGRTVFAGIVIMTALFLFITGCAGLQSKKGTSTSQTETQKDEEPSPLYYDFGDVLIPTELKVDKKSSFVFKTPGLSAGVLSLKGRVETSSLIAFFENNMTKDNWKQVSSFKSPRSMLLYQKENRWCVISITDTDLVSSTRVEVWVAPTMSQTDTGLFK
ncbi:hypothetical protein ACFL03_01505 [Thermodesulfobacteriota bacterium]